MVLDGDSKSDSYMIYTCRKSSRKSSSPFDQVQRYSLLLHNNFDFLHTPLYFSIVDLRLRLRCKSCRYVEPNESVQSASILYKIRPGRASCPVTVMAKRISAKASGIKHPVLPAGCAICYNEADHHTYWNLNSTSRPTFFKFYQATYDSPRTVINIGGTPR